MKYSAICFVLAAALLGTSCWAAAETLNVKISGLSGRSGVVRVMLWKDAAGYPTKPEKSVARREAAVSGAESQVSFGGLQPGTYAAAAYLDENNNGVMDRSYLGWPVEPTAASNGARGILGPPSFAAASFELKQAVQTIQLVFK